MKVVDEIKSPRFLTITAIVLFAAIMRLVIQAPNFTPIMAIAFFGGAYFTRKWVAFLIPMVTMFISDMIIGIYWPMVPWVYGSFAAVVVIGILLRNAKPVVKTVVGTVTGFGLFFLVTNFASWIVMSDINNPDFLMYTRDLKGLITCYIMAIPFAKNSLLSMALYTPTFVFGMTALENFVPSLRPTAALQY